MPIIKYINEQLNIGLEDWQTAWLLTRPFPVKLFTETYRGALVFRQYGKSKRVSYKKLKKHLQKKNIIIEEEKLPF